MTLEPLEHRNTDNPTVGDTRKLLAQVTCSQRVTGSFGGLFNVCIFLRRKKNGFRSLAATLGPVPPIPGEQ